MIFSHGAGEVGCAVEDRALESNKSYSMFLEHNLFDLGARALKLETLAALSEFSNVTNFKFGRHVVAPVTSGSGRLLP